MSPRKTQNKKAGKGCIVIFGLPFFLAGLAVLVIGCFYSTYRGLQSESWPTVQGQLLENRIQSHTDSDGTTYSHALKVEFVYQGNTYITKEANPYLIKSSGNKGHEKLKRVLETQVSQKGTVTVWVDESNPMKSVVDPGVNWGMTIFTAIFGSIFAGVGLLFVIGPFFVKDKAETDDEGHVKAETIPQTISVGMPGRFWAYLLFGAIFTAVGMFVVIASFEELKDGEYQILFAYIFPLVGIWMSILGIKTWFEYKKFGRIDVHLDPHPPRVGGDVAGSIPISLQFDPTYEYKVTLGCFRKDMRANRSDSPGNSGYGHVEWLEEGVAKAESSVRGTHLRFGFSVPENTKPTGKYGDDEYKWMLFLKADLPGLDLNRDIEIPVAEYTGETSEARQKVVYSREEARIDEHVELPRNIVQVGNESDGSPYFYFPASRNRGSAIILLIVGLIFGGAGTGVGYFAGLKEILEKSDQGWFDLIFAIIPTAMGGIFFLIGLLILYFGIVQLFTTLRLVIDHNGTLVYTKKFLFFGSSKIYPLSTLTHLDRKKESTNTGSDSKPSVTYKIICKIGGKDTTLADGLKGTQITDAVEERLRQALTKAGAKL